MNKYDLIVGCDPGYSGAVSFLKGGDFVLFDPPTVANKTPKGSSRYYDLPKVKDIFEEIKETFSHKNGIFAIEKVHPMPNEGSVSSFNFGQGFMMWKMAAVSFGYKLVEIRPMEWKKFYPELITPDKELDKEIKSMQSILKDLRKERKTLSGTEKSSMTKKISAKNKELTSLKSQLKYIAKDKARELASNLFPEDKDLFKRKKDDGRAESLLIANYLKENELV